MQTFDTSNFYFCPIISSKFKISKVYIYSWKDIWKELKSEVDFLHIFFIFINNTGCNKKRCTLALIMVKETEFWSQTQVF